VKVDDSLSRGLLYLGRMQNVDGGWGYHQNGASYVEPTAAAVMAHSFLGAAAPESAWRWLRTAQRTDGGWGVDLKGAAPSWMSAWAVWALAGMGSDAAAADRGARWLLEEPVLRSSDAQVMEEMRRLLDLDATLAGWPWQPGEAAWVLPTSLSLVALAATGLGDHARVQDGVQYLLDRKCATGGWNFGNPVMLGAALPPTFPETAMALMALNAAGVARDHPAVVSGLRYLEATSPELPGGSEGAWRLLGLNAWGAKVAGVQQSLLAGQQELGGWAGGAFCTALALLALAPASAMVWRRS
jgi:hypothetical protein